MSEENPEGEAPPEDPFFQANLAALRAWAPYLNTRLSAITTTHSKLIRDGDLDIELLGERLYRADANKIVDEQLEIFFRKSPRHVLSRPDPERITGVSGDYTIRMDKRMAEAGLVADMDANPVSSEFLIIFGVGLGLHIEPLIERTGAKVVAIVEPNLEFLYHSLHVVDWRSILERAEQDNRKFTFLIEQSPKRILTKLLDVFRNNNPSQLDGTYVYKHYTSSIFERAADMLRRDIYLVVSGLGFVEDEILMTSNAAKNLGTGKARIFTRYMPRRREPVFIVGSGPSAQNDLEFIRSQRERAVIISIGTSLRMLLANDMQPDFHVEIENVAISGEMVQANVRGFDVTGVVLLGSATVDPRTVEVFDRCALFFREQVSSTALFGNRFEVVKPTGPTVANAALLAAIRMGFREIYLFGVDMGSKMAGKYHADDTVYAIGELEEYARETPTLPGNFGGDVIGIAISTGGPVLDWARIQLESVIAAHRGLTVYNCSDGARIAGALPKVSRAVELPDSPVDRARLQAEILAYCPHFTTEMLRNSWIRDQLSAALEDKLSAVERILDAALGEPDPDLPAVVREVFGIVGLQADPDDVILAYISGSMALTMGCATWYDRHLTETARGAECRRMALEELGITLGELREKLTGLFDTVDAMIAAVPATPAAAE